MNKKNQHNLTLFHFSIMWLEKYIEQANYYSDWEKRQQTNYNSHIKWKPNADKALANLGVNLQIEFANNGKNRYNYKSTEFREAVKNEFYKWIEAVKIDSNCCKELKLVLWGVYETIKDIEGGQKIHKSAENSKRELDPDSPEYQEQLQNVFSAVSEAHASGKAFEVDNSRFEGDAKVGKETFEEISNSLSAADKENFHFWPQMTAEERAEGDHKNKEWIDRNGVSFLQAKRTHAINEITENLNQKSQLSNNDLKPENQNWKKKINHAENIIEIQNIQNQVLTDIKAKSQLLLSRQEKWKTTKTFLIIGGVFIIVLGLIGLIYYRKKKNEKRK